jgi:murein DD-endopeptidase MepM/ murein hydrolase activator NlpD
MSRSISSWPSSEAHAGGKAAAVHAFLSNPKHRRLLIAGGVLAIVLVISFMPHGASQAATASAASLVPQDNSATAPKAPVVSDTFELSAASDDFGAVELNWEAQEDAPGYIVYRYNAMKQDYDPIATITDSTETSYVDTDVVSGQTTSYQVTPLFSFDEQTSSNVVDVEVEAGEPELSLEADGQDVQLSWTAVDGADQYTVLRSLEEDGEYAEVAYVNDPEFLDEELTPGRTYYYKVFAEKGDLVTETSNIENTGEIEESAGTYNGGGLQWPVPSGGHISSGFGGRYSPTWGASSNHQGIDISCDYGCDITAAAGGVVTEVSYSGARGNYVVVQHNDELSTLYQHLSATNASVGQAVSAGDTIGYAGSTGISTGTHLHFEVHVYGTPVDPMGYL